MNTVIWDDSKYPSADAFPVEFVYEWRCSCGREHTATFYAGEPGDGDYDSYHFTCPCGAFYKKWARVPMEWIIRDGWRSLASDSPLPVSLESSTMSNDLVPHTQVPVKNFNVNVVDRKGNSVPIKSGSRFRISTGLNESLRNAVCGFCCVMTPYDRTGGDYSVFFVKEGTLEPFFMPLKEWVRNFQIGNFLLMEGPANTHYLGNETPGAISRGTRDL